ncbi:glucose-6-phosphate isomerase [Tistrella mobilis]
MAKTLPFSIDFTGCLADTGAECEALLDQTRSALARLRGWQADGTLPLLRLPAARDDLAALEPLVLRWRDEAADILVLGIGGSSLGAQALLELRDPDDRGPRIHTPDNVDPVSFRRLVDGLDWAGTRVLAVSKSGGTVETVAQLLLVLDRMEASLGRDATAARLVVVAEPGNSPLRRIANDYGVETFDHDPNVGGRFSVLSLVGLLPAMLGGVDAVAIREGAAAVLDQAFADGDPTEIPAAMGAAATAALMQHKGVSQAVQFGYVDRLARFGEWWRQLVGESLGKQGIGLAPVFARGATDQHSQLQLYLDGPRDKLVTVIEPPAEQQPAWRITAEAAARYGVPYLAGRSLGDLIAAEARATAESLIAEGRPTIRMKLDAVDGRTIGALMMTAMIETILLADLLAVDPFDQPAVEKGKVLTREYLAAAG